MSFLSFLRKVEMFEMILRQRTFDLLVTQRAFAANPVRVPQAPVGQTIVFCGLPGCEAARFVGCKNRRAAQRNQDLVVQASPCAFLV
jgi:hypothetical protein